MAYIFKDADGHVTGFSRNRCDDLQEWVEENEPEIWVSPRTIALEKLAQADAPFTPRRVREFMRAVLEDKATEVAAQLGVEVGQVLAANPTYQIVKTYDDMAADARAEL